MLVQARSPPANFEIRGHFESDIGYLMNKKGKFPSVLFLKLIKNRTIDFETIETN